MTDDGRFYLRKLDSNQQSEEGSTKLLETKESLGIEESEALKKKVGDLPSSFNLKWFEFAMRGYNYTEKYLNCRLSNREGAKKSKQPITIKFKTEEDEQLLFKKSRSDQRTFLIHKNLISSRK
jgi:hypothetical protein